MVCKGARGGAQLLPSLRPSRASPSHPFSAVVPSSSPFFSCLTRSFCVCIVVPVAFFVSNNSRFLSKN
jgi:hypothetical protein